MSWASVLTVMFASKVGLLLTALPVAFVFFTINIVGSYLIFGGVPAGRWFATSSSRSRSSRWCRFRCSS